VGQFIPTGRRKQEEGLSKSMNLQGLILSGVFFLSMSVFIAFLSNQRPRSIQIDASGATPKIDVRRLDFDHSGVEVESGSEESLEINHPAWSFFAAPEDEEGVTRWVSSFNLMRRYTAKHGVPLSYDLLSVPETGAEIHRFLSRDTMNGPVNRANFLIRLDRSWLNCVALRWNSDELAIEEVDRLVRSFRLSPAPRPENDRPLAWKRYQAQRKPGTPNAKFILSMDPAPIVVGSHADYLTLIKSSRNGWPPFSPQDYQNGGRMLSKTLLEFYATSDISIRVDCWIDERPSDDSGAKVLYKNSLRIDTPLLDVWSFDNPHTVPITPGQFNQDQLERYEILLQRTDGPARS